MKLYFTKGACSFVVRIIVNELGLKSEFISVDLATKKTEKGEDFLKINPKGAVPTIMLDNGEVLTENAVILQYLADTANAFQLLPKLGDFKRYRVLEWMNYITTELHKTISALFNPNFSEDVKEKVIKPLIKTKVSFVDKHLAKNKFLLGNDFTLPDAYLFVMIMWLHHFKFNLQEWPHIVRYFSELNKRPAIAKSLEAEGLHVAMA